MEQVTQRFDQLDRERFRDMIESPPFQILQRRIESELNRLREITEAHARSIKEIRIAQGGVAALRVVLDLPRRVLDEMSNKKAKP